ncbi:unnamed protein product [Calypogeia fissa]
MAACVAGSIGALAIGGHVVEDIKLRNCFEEDILQAYVMAAVEVTSGGARGVEGSLPSPAAIVLHQGGVELNADAASSLSRRVADVPQDQDVVHVEAMTKILQEIVVSQTPAHFTRGVEKASEYTNFANDAFTDLNKSSNENCANQVEVTAAISSNRTAIGSPVISDGAAQTRDVEGDDGLMSADLIASQAVDAAKDSADIYAPSNELDAIRTLGEVSEIGKGPAVILQGACSVLQDSDTTEVNEILMDEEDVRITYSVMNGCECEPKVEVSSTRTANMDVVDNVNNATTMSRSFSFTGLNHIAFCVESLERSLEFYCGLLGLKTNIDRPELPYRGAWLFVGAEGIDIMEVPNPDPVNGRPAHGGFDRHACLNCRNVEGIRLTLEKAGIPYQPSPVPSLFTRDPDGNGLEFIEVE